MQPPLLLSLVYTKHQEVMKMILADKIIYHRKKLSLTQEELAESLNVSRQSVSKWEGAQSIPDMNKIILLSNIFGVSIDYLMRDELDTPEYLDTHPPTRPKKDKPRLRKGLP